MLQDVLRIVGEAGDMVRRQWKLPRHVQHKGRIDLVTETDVAVENFLKEHLKNVAPGVAFMAEESALSKEPISDCWIIDPVDGTTNFVHGIAAVGISVALWRAPCAALPQGGVELGVVNMPILGECFHAVRDKGAWSGEERLRVSAAAHMQDAVVGTGFPYTIQERLPQILGWLEAVLPVAQGVRRLGAAAVDMAFVAAGRLDAFYEAELQPWDVAAGWLLVEEAGGRVSDTLGNPYRFGEVITASNGLVHQDLCNLLHSASSASR